MPTPWEKFQELMKKLFQFDYADLDFGIHRTMSQERVAIFVKIDSFIQGARSLDPVFKKRMFNVE